MKRRRLVPFAFAMAAVANIALFVAPARAFEDGTKSCWWNGEDGCFCAAPASFPYCSEFDDCSATFPDACKTEVCDPREPSCET